MRFDGVRRIFQGHSIIGDSLVGAPHPSQQRCPPLVGSDMLRIGGSLALVSDGTP